MIRGALHDGRTIRLVSIIGALLCSVVLGFAPSASALGDDADRARAQKILESARRSFYPRLMTSDSAPLRLEGSLSLLHFHVRHLQQKRDSNTYVVDLWQALISDDWGRREDESVREMLDRLCLEFDSCKEAEQASRGKREFQRAGGKGWPFGWRAHRTEWLNAMELMLVTKTGAAETDQWPFVSDADAPFADLYRIGYLMAMRHG